MNLYDKEIRIIEHIQKFEISKIKFYPLNFRTIKVFNSIYFKRCWKKWIDASSKNMLPPDFYNEKLKLMMDTMRVDDHSFIDKNGKIINFHNKRESELTKELISKNESIREAAQSGRLFINPIHYRLGEEDHNYSLYVENFKRVVFNHIEKIKNYKKNHPNFKTIFLIFDESTAYLKCSSNNRPKVPGELFYGELHLWWNDYNLLESFENSRIDYIIWVTPYKVLQTTKRVTIPSICVIDVKKIRYNDTIKYNFVNMQSNEL